MSVQIDPAKSGNRDGFEGLFNWIGRLKVRGEDVYALENNVLELERLTKDVNNELVSTTINNKISFWLKYLPNEKEKGKLAISDFYSLIQATISVLRILKENNSFNPFLASDIILGLPPKPDRATEGSTSTLPDLKKLIELQKKIQDSQRLLLENRRIEPYYRSRNYRKKSRNIVKDSLDIVLDYVSRSIDQLTSIFPEKTEDLPAEISVVDANISPVWIKAQGYENYQFQWEIFVKFSGTSFEATAVLKLVLLISEALDSLSGVSVEIESQGIGSIWYRLRVFIESLSQKQEVKDVLEKARDAAIAEQLDKRIEGTKKLEEERAKTTAERRILEKQIESLPDTEEARKLKALEIEIKELEIREKKADIERKEIENQQQKLALYEKLAYMMKEGMLTSEPVTIEINGLPFLSSENGKLLPGKSINEIDEKGAVKPSEEAE